MFKDIPWEAKSALLGMVIFIGGIFFINLTDRIFPITLEKRVKVLEQKVDVLLEELR